MKYIFYLFLLFNIDINNGLKFNYIGRRDLVRNVPLLSLYKYNDNKSENTLSKSLIKSDNNIYNEKDESTPEKSIIQLESNNIYFYGPVTAESTTILRSQLIDLDKKANIYKIQYNCTPPPINLHIQSNGGSLLHTYYITDLIKNLNTPVYTYIDGFAASAATLISVVGHKRFMSKNSLMLIHQLSSQNSGKYLEIEDDMSNLKTMMRFQSRTITVVTLRAPRPSRSLRTTPRRFRFGSRSGA